MMKKKAAYQSEDYISALKLSDKKMVSLSDEFYATKGALKTIFGMKVILESRGTPSQNDMGKFKQEAKNYFYGTIAPCVLNTQEKLFKKFGFKKVANHTILVDLKKSEEDLWNGLEKKSARWGVKFAKKNDLSFKIATEREVKQFYPLYKKTAKDGRFNSKPLKFLIVLRDTDVSKFFIIKHLKKIVAGGLILIDQENNYSILDLTASSDKGLKLQAMPFLYWQLILYSKSLGLNCFDLGGYDKDAKEGEKTYNINKFKERFGGEIVEQSIYSTNWKYPALRYVLRKFKFLKKLYKK